VVWTSAGPCLTNVQGLSNVEVIAADGGVILWHAMRQHRARFALRKKEPAGTASSGVLRAPMPGRLTKLFVREGDAGVPGDRLAIIEAMKMEHVLHAPAAGSVKRIIHEEGDRVDLGAVILELETGGDHASD